MALRRGSGQHVQDRGQQSRVGGAVPALALEQLADGSQRERQDDAFRLGELERPLDRGLGGTPVAEPLAGRGVEQRRLDRGPCRVKHRRGAFDHGPEQRPRPPADRPLPRARVAAAMRMSARARSSASMPGERGARGSRLAHANLSLHDAVAQLVGQRVLAREQRLHPLRRPERRQRLLEPALGEPHEPAGMVDDQLGAGLAVRPQGTRVRGPAAPRPRRSARATPARGRSRHGPRPRPDRLPIRAPRAIEIASSVSSSATDTGTPLSGAANPR